MSEKEETPSRALRAMVIALTAAAAGSLASCNAYPPAQEGITYRGSLERLEEVQPGDVAVAPIRNQTGNAGVPLDSLRLGFAEGLVERLYSPLESFFTKEWRLSEIELVK